MIDARSFPVSLACAECGSPVHALTCFSVSVPQKSRVKPSDFCSVGCLMDWAIDQHEAGIDEWRAS